jgi:oligoribonuclease (3'-5' exoribonuclease)
MVMESVLKNKKQPSHVVLKDIKVSISSFAYYDMQLNPVSLTS